MPFLPDLEFEYDPDGKKEQVAVVMRGQVYREAGLKNSAHSNVEGDLYDQLCLAPRHKLRDEVRKMALNIAIRVKDKDFIASVSWLDNFMRRFCLSRKKMGFYSSKMLKVKGPKLHPVQGNDEPRGNVGNLVEAGQLVSEKERTIETPSETPAAVSELMKVLSQDDHSIASSNLLISDNSAFNNSSSSTVDDVAGNISSSQKESGVASNNAAEKYVKFVKYTYSRPSCSKENSTLKLSNRPTSDKKVSNKSDDNDESSTNGNKLSKHVVATNSKDCTREVTADYRSSDSPKNGSSDIPSSTVKTRDEKENHATPIKPIGAVRPPMVTIVNPQKLIDFSQFRSPEMVGVKDLNKKSVGDTLTRAGTSKDVIEINDDDDDTDVNAAANPSASSGNEHSSSDEPDDSDVCKRSWNDINSVQYSSAENKYYKKNLSALRRRLEEKNTPCTACFDTVSHSIKAEVFTHPVLGVLLCKKCFRFYGKGIFKKDSEGFDEYCRWCANGGEMLLCDTCTNSFCKRCIKRNLGRTAEKDVMKAKSWSCYVCNLQPLLELRALHRAVLDGLRSDMLRQKGLLRLKRQAERHQLKEGDSLATKRQSDASHCTEDALTTYFSDVLCILLTCGTKVRKIRDQYKMDKSGKKTRAQAIRRMIRLTSVMENCFSEFGNAIKTESQNTPDVAAAVKPNLESRPSTESSPSKLSIPIMKKVTEDNIPGCSSQKIIRTYSSQRKKRRRVSDMSEGKYYNPVKRRMFQNTEEEEFELTEQKGNLNVKTEDHRKEGKVSHRYLDEVTSNEGSDHEAFALSTASSKNPDGFCDTEGNDHDSLNSSILSPVHIHADSAEENEHSLSEEEEESHLDSSIAQHQPELHQTISSEDNAIENGDLIQSSKKKSKEKTIDMTSNKKKSDKEYDYAAGKKKQTTEVQEDPAHTKERILSKKNSSKMAAGGAYTRPDGDTEDVDNSRDDGTTVGVGEINGDPQPQKEKVSASDNLSQQNEVSDSSCHQETCSDVDQRQPKKFSDDDPESQNQTVIDGKSPLQQQKVSDDNLLSKEESKNCNKFSQPEKVSEDDQLSQKEKVSDGDQLSQKEKVSDDDQLSKKEKVSDGDQLSQKEKVSDGDQLSQKEKVSEDHQLSQKEKVSDGDKLSQKEKVSDGDQLSKKEKVSDGDQLSQKEKASDGDQQSQKERDSDDDQLFHKEKISDGNQLSHKEKVSDDDQLSEKEKVIDGDQLSQKEKASDGDQLSQKEKVSGDDQLSQKEKVSDSDQLSQKERVSDGGSLPRENKFRNDDSLKHKKKLSKGSLLSQQEKDSDDVSLSQKEDSDGVSFSQKEKESDGVSLSQQEKDSDDDILAEKEHTWVNESVSEKHKNDSSNRASSEASVKDGEKGNPSEAKHENQTKNDVARKKSFRKHRRSSKCKSITSADALSAVISSEDETAESPGNISQDLFLDSEEDKEGIKSKHKQRRPDKGLKLKTPDKNAALKKSLLASDSSDDGMNDEILLQKEFADIARNKTSLKKRHKTLKKRRRQYRPVPKSVQNSKQKAQLESQAAVVVNRMDRAVEEELEDAGFVSVDDYPLLMQMGSSEEDSDEEFNNLLKFKAIKKPGSRSDSDSELSDSDTTKSEDTAKKKETVEKSKVEISEKKKKEGLLDISLHDEGGEDEEEMEKDDEKENENKETLHTSKMIKALLESSEDEGNDEDQSDDNDVADLDILDKTTTEELEADRRKKYDLKKKKMEEKRSLEEEKENGNKENQTSDSESEDEDINKRGKRKYFSLKNILSSDEGSNDDDDDDDEDESPRKSRLFNESDSDFEDEMKKKKRKNIFDSSDASSDSSSENEKNEEKKPKSRKRIKRAASSSEEEEEVVEDGDQESPNKKRRRKIIRDEDLLQSTKNATQEEEERRDRVRMRQKLYNKIFEIDVEKDQKDLEKLVLDFDEETKKELVNVDTRLLPSLKPHQAEGIKFIYDATIESVTRLEDNEKGGGCILAHCMGLGKTLQVIAYVHTLLNNKRTNRHINRVMVCCPVNTVYNWLHEFQSWLKGKLMTFDVIELISAKDLWGRAYRLDDWFKEGGVCIIGYDMFRNLSNPDNKRYKGQMKTIFQKALVKPGPDLIVCDEGHILKNEKTALSVSCNRIRTMRRIILTGTPLQNNLKEYHCMIQFVKPNLLGSKKEFMNRFVNPITNGQTIDAESRDVRRMKRRAHILHNLLEGCVQRFDYTVLKPFLPPKYEYVISVQMTEIQCALYRYYLENLAQGGPKRTGSGLFVDFNNLSRIWSHPAVLYLALRRKELQGEEDEEEEGNLDGFIDDSDTSDSTEDEKPKKRKKETKSDDDEIVEEEVKKDDEDEAQTNDDNTPGLTSSGKVKPDWWRTVLESVEGDDYDEDQFLNRLEISGKLYLLFDILRECGSIGDKVLLFSQSILALDMIENFLKMVDDGDLELPSGEEKLQVHFKHWKPDRDYVRLDGSISADQRKHQCKQFNRSDNERCRLFLISTRAGGVGINLIGANRVVLFDSSWNPSHDTQSIFRVYRFGQSKPCYVYRFVAQGTMEEKIYSRQVTKISTSLRVVDEQQIKRYFNMAELAELYQFNPEDPEKRETPNVPEDRLLAEMLIRNKNYIVGYHEHDSLLENQAEEELTEEERKAAWEDFENEKKGLVEPQPRNFLYGSSVPVLNSNIPLFDSQSVIQSIYIQNPNVSQAQLMQNVLLATQQIQKAHLTHYQKIQSCLYSLKNPMIAPEIKKQLPYANQPEMIPVLQRQLQTLEQNIQKENQVIGQLTKMASNATSQNSMIVAGLARGHPSTSAATSSTANYVARNYVNILPSTLSQVNTNFKKITLPPAVKVTVGSAKSTAVSTGSDTNDQEATTSTEVVTLE